jgi:hypothetical protein
VALCFEKPRQRSTVVETLRKNGSPEIRRADYFLGFPVLAPFFVPAGDYVAGVDKHPLSCYNGATLDSAGGIWQIFPFLQLLVLISFDRIALWVEDQFRWSFWELVSASGTLAPAGVFLKQVLVPARRRRVLPTEQYG